MENDECKKRQNADFGKIIRNKEEDPSDATAWKDLLCDDIEEHS